MVLGNVSIVGWAHTLLTVLALVCALVIMVTRKGTARHRLLGDIYAISLFVGSALSLTIYRTGAFFFPHVLAIVTMVFIAIGWAAGRFHQPKWLWKPIHLTCMLLSLYMIIGGGINEAFLRVAWLREHGKAIWIGQAHAFTLLGFVLLILLLNFVQLFQFLRARFVKKDKDALPVLRKS
jgi:hypothetical protein